MLQKCSLALALVGMMGGTAQASLVGLWEFNDGANPYKATAGKDLVLLANGGGPGSDAAASGIGASDGARLIGPGNYYEVNYGVADNGGGSYVNEFTMLFDVNVPATSLGSWMAFYQTGTAPYNDSEMFISPSRAIGVGDTGYSSNTVSAETWYRVVVSADLGSSYKIYVDGNQWLSDATPPGVDGRFALYNDKWVAIGDNSGDDAPIRVSNMAFWNEALDSTRVQELGSAGDPIPVQASVANIDPAWTVVQTTPGPYNFSDPGNNTGDPRLRIGGQDIPFHAGVVLASSRQHGAGDDNITAPYWDPDYTSWMSVQDTPNGAEENTAVSVGFFPYAQGWKGAAIAADGTVLSGSAAVTKTGTGVYEISGLPSDEAGQLFAVPNGNGSDNVASPEYNGATGRWVVQTWDDDGATLQDKEFSFLFIDGYARNVYFGELDGGAAVNMSKWLETAGVTVTPAGTGMFDVLIGDGSVINPNTATMFLSAADAGGSSSDNVFSWIANGSSFRVRSWDLPNGGAQTTDFRFLVIPFDTSAVSPMVPEPSTLALAALGLLGLAVFGWRQRRRRLT